MKHKYHMKPKEMPKPKEKMGTHGDMKVKLNPKGGTVKHNHPNYK